MSRKVVFITGVAGYIGRVLRGRLAAAPWCNGVHGVDIQPPRDASDSWRACDINSPDLADTITECGANVVVHCAAVVKPIRDRKLRRRVNVDGTRNVLDACVRAKVQHVVVLSSGTAYGAHADNPVPLCEDAPLRANPGFGYANDKHEVERLCARFEQEHPAIRLAVLRPCVVYGRNVDNYLSALIDQPRVPVFRGHEPPMQFVHEDDVSRAIEAVIARDATGAFNIAPPDTITQREIAECMNRPVFPAFVSLARLAVGTCRLLRLNVYPFPPAFLNYMIHPWVLDSSRLCDELDFAFEYTTRETVDATLRARGVIE